MSTMWMYEDEHDDCEMYEAEPLEGRQPYDMECNGDGHCLCSVCRFFVPWRGPYSWGDEEEDE